VHRLDRINAKKPAKLLDSKSLTFHLSCKQNLAGFFQYIGHNPGRTPSFLFADHTLAIRRLGVEVDYPSRRSNMLSRIRPHGIGILYRFRCTVSPIKA
jgi:hypothetical protein